MDFSALHGALSGLRAAQIGIDVTANNVANVGTEGYTRQRVDQVTRPEILTPDGPVGVGVKVDDVIRIRDLLLDARAREGIEGLATLATRSGLLIDAETIMGEPDAGLTNELGHLWGAMEDWSNRPDGRAERVAVLSGLSAITDRMNTISTNLRELEADAADDLASTVARANDLMFQVRDLNLQIVAQRSAAERSPNGLMDQRDLLVDELSSLIGASAHDAGDGMVRVNVGGLSLVDGPLVNTLSTSGTSVVYHTGQEVPVGGEALGYKLFAQGDLADMRAQLDAFTVDFATAINDTNAAGWVSETEQGADLLSFDVDEPSATIALVTTDPQKLAAAGSNSPYGTLDPTNAIRFADLRSENVANGGTTTLDGAYRAVVTEFGQRVASTVSAARTQEAIATSAETARTNAHAVSLDEEMVRLMEYQRAYEAAARTITAVDEALDTLINRTGLVGR